jgi:hypothetical protein
MTKTTVHLPSLRSMARFALPSLVESTVGPAVLFYVVLVVLGTRGALLAALAWSYLAVARRVVTGRRFPGVLLLGTLLITARTAISLATGSAFVYFLQPTLGTFLVALAFLVSVPLGRPLAERLAHDFCPLDPDLVKRDFIRRFFLRISLLWTFVLLLNASINLWLLLVSPLRSFVLLKSAVSIGVIGAAVVVSTLWFRRSLHGEGIHVRWSRRTRLATVTVEG